MVSCVPTRNELSPSWVARVAKCRTRLRSPSSSASRRSSTSLAGGRRVPRSVLWRGYVLAIAAALERVGGAHPFTDPLADSLAEDLSGTSWLPSFVRSIWPCEHALELAELALAAGARRDERAALYRYNPSSLYVDAEIRCTRAIARDSRRCLVYYSRQVYARTATGVRRISGPRS